MKNGQNKKLQESFKNNNLEEKKFKILFFPT